MAALHILPFSFTLSSDRKTITFAGDTTGGHFGTLEGEFTKQ